VVVVVVDEDSVVALGATGCTTVVEGGGSTVSVFLYEKQPIELSSATLTKPATKYCVVFMIWNSPLGTINHDFSIGHAIPQSLNSREIEKGFL
jgi:hypothetical protein